MAGLQTKQKKLNSDFDQQVSNLNSLYGASADEPENVLKDKFKAGKEYFSNNADSILPKALVAVTALTFFVAVWQVRANFSVAPVFSGAETSTHSLTAALNSGLAGSDTDTDGDGITDADELGIYGTSIYLADSDSDGVSDYDEVAAGSDPNCLPGEDCSNKLRQQISPSATGGNLPSNLLGAGQALDASDLRNILVAEGVPEEDLDLLSDADIADIYNQAAVAATTGSTAAPDLSETSAGTEELEDLISDLSADELRQLLLQSGQISAEQLEQVSDNELLDLVDDVLNN